jgi:hypothetical protein
LIFPLQYRCPWSPSQKFPFVRYEREREHSQLVGEAERVKLIFRSWNLITNFVTLGEPTVYNIAPGLAFQPSLGLLFSLIYMGYYLNLDLTSGVSHQFGLFVGGSADWAPN